MEPKKIQLGWIDRERISDVQIDAQLTEVFAIIEANVRKMYEDGAKGCVITIEEKV